MKVLIIRFSSIGDVTQALSLPAHIKSKYPNAEVHFLTKQEYQELLAHNDYVTQTWGLPHSSSLKELFHFIVRLNQEKFTHIYDAHNNLRSNLFYFFLKATFKIQKPMQRWKRFLLLKFKINLFEMPFSGQRDLLKPLEQWSIPFQIPPAPVLFFSPSTLKQAENILFENKVPSTFIILVPSAAHPFKKWPIEKWESLIAENPQSFFVVLAGPKDHFTRVLNKYSNVINLTGKTTLIESAALISKASFVIANDTGLLHFSEQLGKPTVALMGAAPFGFPSRKTTIIIKKDLPCWPCSKHGQGPCTNKVYHQCMNDIRVEEVSREINK